MCGRKYYEMITHQQKGSCVEYAPDGAIESGGSGRQPVDGHSRCLSRQLRLIQLSIGIELCQQLPV